MAQALVAAIITAPGQLPRPAPTQLGSNHHQHHQHPGQTGAAAGGSSSLAAAADSSQHHHKGLHLADRSGSAALVDWEAAELCLDLLLVRGGGQWELRVVTDVVHVLLSNSLLWKLGWCCSLLGYFLQAMSVGSEVLCGC
jgi:hypothetical protein